MKLTFWGAAGTVTGSMHHLEVNGRNYLLDCGMYQGRRKEAEERNRHFPFPPQSISAMILSHAHIDHSGNLPLLVKNGFSGPIYATPATVDLCNAMLMDAAHIQENDVKFLRKRRPQEHVEALYTTQDAERTMPLFRPAAYYTPTTIDENLSYQAYDAGHMLGSSSVVIQSGPVHLAFSGDVGRPGLPIIRDPDPLPPADYLIMESTYGGRFHEPIAAVVDKLADIVNRTAARGGKIIVPAFAVGRTQQLVLLLHQLANEKRIPDIPYFVDSPLAVDVTAVFRRHPECFNEETRKYLEGGGDPFGFKLLRYVREAADSKALNSLRGPAVIISPSGMCEVGRVVHHLRNNIEDPRATILITGYQADNTLGRKLVDGAAEVRIFGDPMHVRAEVESLDALSGHADQGELLAWMKPMTPGLKKIFLVHGEDDAPPALAKAIQAQYRIETIVPQWGQSFEIG